jgi:phenylalanyl-tRNA synthetase beta chain
MNISYNWLKDLIEINLNPQELAEKLTAVGLAVEGVHQFEDDFVFDIDLTSNRPDCLSHLGVAREINVIQGTSFKPNIINNYQVISGSEAEQTNLVTIQDPELCRRFTGRVIRKVKIAPSPEWMVKRLEAIGQRSINNVADITNYVMHELGNPMHAFDYSKLTEGRIVVRRAAASEKIVTLDGVERELKDEMLAICDAEKPVAVAGIMGGQFSAISDETTDVFLEVAYFKRESIRQTSRQLGLATEANYRFERGVDIENLLNASNRCVDLICQYAGGTADEPVVDVFPQPHSEMIVSLRPARVPALTGLNVENDEILRILQALGLKLKDATDQTKSTFIAPTWRYDMEQEEDLVEEIARHVGYDKIAEELPPSFVAGEYQPTEPRKKTLRQTLATIGFNEAISYSFIDQTFDEKFDLLPDLVNEFAAEKFITLQDSIIEGAIRMRPTLLPGLLNAVRTNFNFGRRDLKLFELGKIFAAVGDSELPVERESFALVMTGGEMFENRAGTTKKFDFYDAKGALEMAFDSLNLPKPDFQVESIKHLRDGQSAVVSLNGRKIGSFGLLADSIADGFKFRQPVFVAEIDLETVFLSGTQTVTYRPLPEYPAIVRDVSLLIKRRINFVDLKQTIAEMKVENLQSTELVDIYEGQGLADEERSVTIRLEFRAENRTLRDEEVDSSQSLIIQTLENRLGAKQRV